MTSEEIKNYSDAIRENNTRFPPGKSASLDTALLTAEVAYQLARFNEREEKTIEQIIAERGA